MNEQSSEQAGLDLGHRDEVEIQGNVEVEVEVDVEVQVQWSGVDRM